MAPITGTFQADFASFYDAVQKAEVSLTKFEAGSAKAEAQLNRMANSLNGTKMIQDAVLMAEAVERVGGASTLTEKQLASVGRAASEAVEKLQALGQEVPQNLQKVADAARDAENAQGGFLARVKESAAGYVAGMLSLQAMEAAGRKVIDFFKESISQAAEAEATHRRLTVAMENQGSAMPALIDEYDRLAQSTSRTTTFTDDAIKELEVMLIQVGNVLPSQMEKAVKATTDLASGMGIDLSTAATTMAKASEGNTAALQKMGVQLDDARVKGEGLEYIAGQIEKRFGGQAAAELETYSGKVKQLSNQWGELEEAVGRLAINGGALSFLQLLTTGANGLSGALEGNILGAVQLAKQQSLGAADAKLFASGMDVLNGILGGTLLETEKNNKATAELEQQLKQSAAAAKEAEAAFQASADAEKRAAEDAKKHAAALKELESFSTNYLDTLATVNAQTVEEVKGFLAAGASANTLQEAYKLTEGQIKAITMARAADIEMAKRQNDANEALVRADAQALQMSSKLWREYADAKASIGGTTIDRQIAEINRWAEAEKAQFEALKNRLNMSASNVKDFYDALAAATAEKLNKIGIDTAALTDAATKHSQAGLEQTALSAERTYEIAKQHVGEWSDATIEKFRLTAEAARQAANDFGVGFAGALDPIPAKVDKITDSLAKASAAARGLFPDSGASGTVPTGFSYPDVGGASMFLRPDLSKYFQPRANGGPVSAGETYLVGERGPELFVPSSSGSIVPNGAGRSIVFAPGSIQISGLILDGDNAKERLVSMIADEFQSRLRLEA